jgi:type IV fimbrial biogenesis protein FimU
MNLCTKGFTLIELLVTLAIGGLLLTLVVPAFNQSLQRNKVESELNELLRALNYARLEAIERGAAVRFGPADGSGHWSGELAVYQGRGALANVLRVVPALSRGAHLALPSTIDAVVFTALGGLGEADQAVLMRYQRAELRRSISVCLNGRIVSGGGCQ